MNRTSVLLLPAAALAFGIGTAAAHEVAIGTGIAVPEGNGSYVTVGGNALRTGGGECVRVGGFSEEDQVDACEGIEAAEVVADASALEPEPAPTPEPVVKEPIIDIATLGAEALFDTNSADLGAAGEQALADLLVRLDTFQEISEIEIVGHSDGRGAEDYNLALSERRAQSVQAFLQAAYPDLAITSRGEGESNPVATNSTPQGRQLNRRVEIRVTAKSITDA